MVMIFLHEDCDEKKSSFDNRISSHAEDISQSSSLPVSDSVHVLGGLDINEMDCFRRRVSTLLS